MNCSADVDPVEAMRRGEAHPVPLIDGAALSWTPTPSGGRRGKDSP